MGKAWQAPHPKHPNLLVVDGVSRARRQIGPRRAYCQLPVSFYTAPASGIPRLNPGDMRQPNTIHAGPKRTAYPLGSQHRPLPALFPS